MEKGNIIRMGIVHFLLKTEFWFPIWVIFLLNHGLNFSEVIIADIFFRISMTLLEFPLGSIGDKIGRKKTYIGGALFYGLALISMVIIQNFYFLLISWFIWAVAWVLISGTDTAFIYELILMEKGKEQEMQIFGYFTAIQNSALVISHFSAGFLYKINPNLPLLLNGILYCAAGFLLFTIRDPGVKENLIPNFKQIIKTTKNLMKQPKIRNLVLILSLLLMYQWTTTLIFQPLLLFLNIDIELFGFYYITFTILGILAGMLVGFLTKKLSTFFIIKGGIIATIITIGLVGFLPGKSALLGIIFLGFTYSLAEAVLKVMLNQSLTGKARSSIFSLVSLFSSVSLALSRPIIGFISNKTSPIIAFRWWFIVGLVLGCLLLIFIIQIQIRANDNDNTEIENKKE